MSFSSFRDLKATKAKSSFVTSDGYSATTRGPTDPEKLMTPSFIKVDDLLSYSGLPPFLEIRSTEVSGRGVYVNILEKDVQWKISAGTCLISVEPHVHALSSTYLSKLCSACHRPDQLMRCTNCKIVYYCSPKCQTADWGVHKRECISLQFWSRSPEGQGADNLVKIPGEAVRAMARLLWIREKKRPQSLWAKQVEAMQSHHGVVASDKLGSQQSLTIVAQSLARFLSASETPKPDVLSALGLSSARDVLVLISRFAVNSFALTNPSLTSIGVAMSPLVALVNHSCVPNAVVVFPRSSNLYTPASNPIEVVAIRDILPGEEILTSYVDISLPYHLRSIELRDRYFFDCQCPDCSRSQTGRIVDCRSAIRCGRTDCAGLIAFPGTNDVSIASSMSCSACGDTFSGDIGEVMDVVRLGEEALEKAQVMEMDDPASSVKYTSTLTPLLSHRIPPTSHPLFALTRLHLSLLISQISEVAITTDARLPCEQVDAVCRTASICVAASSMIFPEGHPVRAIAMAELGKLLCVDIDADEGDLRRLEGSTTQEKPGTGVPVGEERMKLARSTLIRAREYLRRGFGGEGGEVGREIEACIRNLEKEWRLWREVVAQGGLQSRSNNRDPEIVAD